MSRPATMPASQSTAGSVSTGRPSSCAATAGHDGSSSRRCAATQARHAVLPGFTNGPTSAPEPVRATGT